MRERTPADKRVRKGETARAGAQSALSAPGSQTNLRRRCKEKNNVLIYGIKTSQETKEIMYLKVISQCS